MKKTISPRLNERVRSLFEQTFNNVSAGAELVLALFFPAYQKTLAYELRDMFTAGELAAIVEACNGYRITPEMAGDVFRMAIKYTCDLEKLDQKWDFDKQEFYTKLSSLTLFQAICLEIWGCAFWVGAYSKGKDALTNYVAQFLGDV